MLIALFVIIGLSILILGHEAGHFAAAKLFGLKVDEFGIGFPPRLWSKKKGETTYSVNWLPFGGFVRIAGENDHMDSMTDTISEPDRRRFFYTQPVWKRSVIILAGVTVNFLLAWALISATFMMGSAPTLLVSEVEAGSPAAAAGIQPGDTITGFRNTQEFIAYIQEHKGQEIGIGVTRGNDNLNFRVTPRLNPAPDQGAVGLGFSGVIRRGPGSAITDGFTQTRLLAWYTLAAFGSLVKDLFTHGALPKDVVGLVGIFPVAQQVGQAGWIHLVQLLAMISVNLAVINLLPFPALDGGRFILILIEKLKGSPLPRKAEAWINTFGFAFLLLLMILITIRDISRL
jgi:regulator of sigma E protease